MRFSLAIVALATVVAAKPRSCKYSDIADEQVELEGLYQSLDEVHSPWERFWINREIKELKAELKKCGVKVDEDQPEGTTSTIGVADKRSLDRRARKYSCKYSDIADEQVELEGLYQELEDAKKPWEKFWLEYQIKELKAELKKCGVKVDDDQPEGTTTTIGIADKRDLSERESRVARRSLTSRARTYSCKYSDIADEQVELEGLYQDLEDADKPWEKFWINYQIKELKAELKKCGVKVDDDQPEGTTTTIGVADKRGLKKLPKWLTDKYAECVARPHSNPMSSIWLAQAAELEPSLLGPAKTEFKIASRQSIGCGSIDALEDYLFYLFAVYGAKPSPYQLALMQKAFEIIYTCGRDVSKWTTVVPALTIPGGTVVPSTGGTGSTTITPSTGSSGSTTTITPSTGSSGSGTTIVGSGGQNGSSGTTITPSGGSGSSGTTISPSNNNGSSGTSISPSGSSGSGTTISPSGGSGSGTSISSSGGSGGAVIPSGGSNGASSGVRVAS